MRLIILLLLFWLFAVAGLTFIMAIALIEPLIAGFSFLCLVGLGMGIEAVR